MTNVAGVETLPLHKTASELGVMPEDHTSLPEASVMCTKTDHVQPTFGRGTLTPPVQFKAYEIVDPGIMGSFGAVQPLTVIACAVVSVVGVTVLVGGVTGADVVGGGGVVPAGFRTMESM